MVEKLDKYHILLNDKDILPEGYLARNHLCYPLVCYINIIIGMYISKNFNQIPLFIKRAHEHLLIRRDKFAENEKYRALVMEYLSSMAIYVNTLDIEEMNKDLIPRDLL